MGKRGLLLKFLGFGLILNLWSSTGFALTCNTVTPPTVNEDGSVTVTLTATLSTGETFTGITVPTLPSHGTFTVASTGTRTVNYTYKPDQNYNGADSFAWKASASYPLMNRSCTQTVNVTVTPVNDAPKAFPIFSVAATEDTPVTITLRGSDVETAAAALTYALSFDPKTFPGSLVKVSGNQYKYAPKPNFHGEATFSYTASDGQLTSNSAKVNIDVAATNDPPVASSISTTTAEDTSVTVMLNATDPDGDTNALLYYVKPVNWHDPGLEMGRIPAGVPYTIPGSGTISITGKTVTFTPQKNLVGTINKFSYEVVDSVSASVTKALDFTMTPVNDPPVAANATIPASTVINEDAAAPVLLTVYGATDVDDPASALTHVFDATSAHGGTLVRTTAPANFTPYTQNVVAHFLNYAPPKNYSGPDTFTYVATDPSGAASNRATVSFIVMPVSDPPEAVNVTATTPRDTPVTIHLAGSDPDGDPLKFSLTDKLGAVYGQYHGKATLVNENTGEILFTPDAGFVSSGTANGIIKFKVSDAKNNCKTVGIATITVTKPAPTIDPRPTVNNLGVRTKEEEAVSFTLTGSDPAGGALTFQITEQPAKGLVSGTGANLTYAPGAHQSGTDTLEFTATNAADQVSEPGFVRFTIENTNEAPVAESKEITTDENTPVTAEVTATDADGDQLSYQIVASPHGKSKFDGNDLTYAPDQGFNGIAEIKYRAFDGRATSPDATVAVTVNGDNDKPIAHDAEASGKEDTVIRIVLSAVDPDGDELNFVLKTQAAHGAVRIDAATNTAVYTPDENYSGADRFTFAARDPGGLESEPAAIDITLRAVPDPFVDCEGSVGPEHLQSGNGNEKYYDNVISVLMARAATENEIDEMTETAGASGMLCRIEQAPLTPDEAGCAKDQNGDPTGCTVNPEASGYATYLFEIPPQENLSALVTIAETLKNHAYVEAAFPRYLEEMGPDAAGSDTEGEAFAHNPGRATAPHFYPHQLQGALEYLRAYTKQGGSLNHVQVAVMDSGVCAHSDCPGGEGISEEFRGIITEGSTFNVVGQISLPDYPNVTQMSLFDANFQLHGSNVAALIGALSNGNIVSPPRTSIFVAPYSGILGSVHSLPYGLTSYLAPSAVPSYKWDYAKVDWESLTYKSICDNVDISNHSYGTNHSKWQQSEPEFIAAHTAHRQQISRLIENCPDNLFLFSGGNDGLNLDSETDFANFRVSGHSSASFVPLANTADVQACSLYTDIKSLASNRGVNLDIAAAGKSTSYSTPMVTATAALLRSINPGLSPPDLVETMRETGRLTDDTATPFLDISASVLKAMHDKNPIFVPMNLESADYSYHGDTDGMTSDETGQWFIDNAKKLTVIREGTDTKTSATGPNGAYDWQSESKSKFEQNFELAMDDITDEDDRTVPVMTVAPTGEQKFELSGKFHAYRFGGGSPALDDQATAYCFKAELELGATDTGYHVPLARESKSENVAVSYAVTGARLTGNVVKMLMNDETGEDSADSGDEVGYAGLQPSCEGDVTSGASSSSPSDDPGEPNDPSAPEDPEEPSENSGPSWEIWCETWKPNVWDVNGAIPDGYPDGACCLYWIFEACREQGPDIRVAGPSALYPSGENLGCTEDGQLAPHLPSHANGCTEPPTSPCYCRQIGGDDTNDADDTTDEDSNDCDESESEEARQIPTKVSTHFDVTLGNVTCSQTANSETTKSEDDIRIEGDVYQTFDLTTGIEADECVASAQITIRSVFEASKIPDQECGGSGGEAELITETAVKENSFSAEFKWDFSAGKFPLSDAFEKLGPFVQEQMNAFASDETVAESDSRPGAFSLQHDGAQFYFMPEALLHTGLKTPSFGTDMATWHWAHGVGPLNPSDAQDEFHVESVQKTDRTVR